MGGRGGSLLGGRGGSLMGGRGGNLLGGVRDAASRLGLGRSSYNYDSYNQGPYRRQCAATQPRILARILALAQPQTLTLIRARPQP